MAREIRDEKERLLQEIRDKEITVAGIEDIDLNTDGLETLQTATNTKLDALETTLTAIETDQAALEVLQTSTNTKLDTLETTLTAIETDIAALEVLQTTANSDTVLVKNSSLSAIAPSNAILIDDMVAHTGPYFAITCIGTVAAVVDISECDMSFIDDVADFTIPIGVTIYGTFASIELDSGVVIAYTL